MKDIKLSVIIPVYNEVNTILEVIRLVKNERHKKEIIIIDDRSTDRTRELLSSIHDDAIKVLFNEVNRGKGYSIRRGLEQVTGDIVIIQDADLEYYPDEYGILIQKILEGKADVVYGSRFLGQHRVFHFFHYLGNSILNLIANIILDTNLTDLMTGYKVFKTPVIRSLKLYADRFGIEAEITAEVFKRRYRVYEVPISYSGRTYEEGKKIKWTDFFVSLGWLLKSALRGIVVEQDTLVKMTMMRNNNRWTYDKIKPFLGKKVLELGSGLGTFSNYLLNDGEEVTLTDINEEYEIYLKNRFIGNPWVKILRTDIACIDEAVGVERFDTVVGINVLEHIDNDVAVLQKINKVLSADGKIIFLVPAHQALLSDFDKKLGHYRRYSKKELQDKLVSAGFTVKKIEFMNFIGAIGWFIKFRILRDRYMPGITIQLLDKFIPLIALIEKYVKFNFGLSLFCIGETKK